MGLNNLTQDDVFGEYEKIRPFLPPLSFRDLNGVLCIDESSSLTGSFKFRAALSSLIRVAGEAVVTASTGNFAKSLKILSNHFDVEVTSVVPITTSTDAILFLKTLPGKVLIAGNDLNESIAIAKEYATLHGLKFLSTVSEETVMGAASMFCQLVESTVRFPEKLFIPIGQGTLAAAAALMLPNKTLIGVTPGESPSFATSFLQNEVTYKEVAPSKFYSYQISLPDRGIFELIHRNFTDVIEVKSGAVFDFSSPLGAAYEADGLLGVVAALQRGDEALAVLTGGPFKTITKIASTWLQSKRIAR